MSLSNSGKHGCDACDHPSCIRFQLDTQGTQGAGGPCRLSEQCAESEEVGFWACACALSFSPKVTGWARSSAGVGQIGDHLVLGGLRPGPTHSLTCLPLAPRPAAPRLSFSILPPSSFPPPTSVVGPLPHLFNIGLNSKKTKT